MVTLTKGTSQVPSTVNSDRRRARRRRVLKGGKIVWPNGAAFECRIRDISETGARLEVNSPVPKIFQLVIPSEQFRNSCRVIWRRGTEIGVQFL